MTPSEKEQLERVRGVIIQVLTETDFRCEQVCEKVWKSYNRHSPTECFKEFTEDLGKSLHLLEEMMGEK